MSDDILHKIVLAYKSSNYSDLNKIRYLFFPFFFNTVARISILVQAYQKQNLSN